MDTQLTDGSGYSTDRWFWISWWNLLLDGIHRGLESICMEGLVCKVHNDPLWRVSRLWRVSTSGSWKAQRTTGSDYFVLLLVLVEIVETQLAQLSIVESISLSY